jgi:Ceramidase
VSYTLEVVCRTTSSEKSHIRAVLPLCDFRAAVCLLTLSPSLRPPQADDLAMLFATDVVLHRILTVSTPRGYTAFVGISLTAFLAVLSYVHCSANELIMHSMTFGIMIMVIGFHTMRLLQKIERPLVRRKLSTLARTGAGIFPCFLVFSVDTHTCDIEYVLSFRASRACGFAAESGTTHTRQRSSFQVTSSGSSTHASART